jgi:repressor LexA
MTQSQLASSFNLAESTVSLYELGRRTPDYEMLIKFANFFNVTVDYLLGNAEERRPPVSFREDGEQYDPEKKDAYPPARLPVVTAVRAGPRGVVFEKEPAAEWVSGINVSDGNFFWLKAKDDAMSGHGILPGDFILIREQSELEYGEMGLILIPGEEGCIRRYYKNKDSIVLLPSNPYTPPRIFTGKERAGIRVVGKVVQIRRTYQPDPV